MRTTYFRGVAHALTAASLGSLLTNCSASGEPASSRDLSGGPTTSNNSSAASAAVTGAGGGTSSTAANTAVGNGISVASSSATSGGGTTGSCQQTSIEFTPDIPTVFILVDRSSSMWEMAGNVGPFWEPFRDGVLQVVQQLHQDVRFGLATFTGDASTCPLDLETAGPIDLNNYDPIAAFYNAVQPPGMATETPTPAAIQAVQALLEADNVAFPGPKFMLLVTDGNPDYCDNGDNNCRADTTVLALQNAYTAGIGTFVVALPNPNIDQDWLLAFANAGMGEPVGMVNDSVQYCGNNPPPAHTAALFPTTWPHGTYSATMGPATPYQVDPANRDALVSSIAGVVAGVKSCIFDLQGDLQIIEGLEAEGKVLIRTSTSPEVGVEQPYDPTGVNGWKVNNGTQIELVGSSCDALRSPDTIGIDFGFPCEIFEPT